MLSKPTRNLETKYSIFHEKFNSLNRKMISIRQLEYQYFCVFSDRLECINAFAKYRKYDGVATRTRQIRYHHEENSNLGPNKLHTPFHQHFLFPTMNNNCKLYIVLQLIIVKFRASLRTKQYYWLKNCWASAPGVPPLICKFCFIVFVCV